MIQDTSQQILILLNENTVFQWDGKATHRPEIILIDLHFLFVCVLECVEFCFLTDDAKEMCTNLEKTSLNLHRAITLI